VHFCAKLSPVLRCIRSIGAAAFPPPPLNPPLIYSKADWPIGVFFLPIDGPKLTVVVRVNGVATSDWSAVEGSTVNLECSTAVANPPVIPEATWWLRDGAFVQDARQPLVIERLDRSHAGRYTCSATNTLAPSGELPRNVTATATVRLQVMCE